MSTPGRSGIPFLIACISVAVLAVGCACGPVVTMDDLAIGIDDAEEAALVARLSASELPFTGFAPFEPDGAWRIGDELLYGVEFGTGEKRRNWILGLRIASGVFGSGQGKIVEGEDDQVRVFHGQVFSTTLTDETGRQWTFSSDSILVQVHAYDADGGILEKNLSRAPERFLAEGLAGACALFADGTFGPTVKLVDLPDDEAEELGRTFAGVFASLISIFQVLQENETLADILWKVVRKPSVLSVIARLGVSVNLEPELDRTERVICTVPGAPEGADVFRFPLTIGVNDSPALLCSLTVTKSGAPIHVSGGLLAIDGRHPRDPDKIVRVRLLASRRGEPAPPEKEEPAGAADSTAEDSD